MAARLLTIGRNVSINMLPARRVDPIDPLMHERVRKKVQQAATKKATILAAQAPNRVMSREPPHKGARSPTRLYPS